MARTGVSCASTHRARRDAALVIIASTIALGSCGGRPVADTSTSTTSTPTAVASTAEQHQDLAALRDQLSVARQELENQYNTSGARQTCFTPPLLLQAPANLTEFDLGMVSIIGMGADGTYGSGALGEYRLGPMGAAVNTRLVDRSDPARWVDFQQGEDCWGGVIGIPPGATSIETLHQTVIPGLDAKSAPQIHSWSEASGTTVQLMWGSNAYTGDGTGYQLTGHGVPETTLMELAASMQPVCCSPPPPTTTVTAPSGTIGVPLPVAWSTGSATVTLESYQWLPDPEAPFSGMWLIVDMTYRATSGVVSYNRNDWSVMVADGSGMDDVPLGADQSAPLPPGAELKVQIQFPVPTGPTTLVLAEVWNRLATWPIPG